MARATLSFIFGFERINVYTTFDKTRGSVVGWSQFAEPANRNNEYPRDPQEKAGWVLDTDRTQVSRIASIEQICKDYDSGALSKIQALNQFAPLFNAWLDDEKKIKQRFYPIQIPGANASFDATGVCSIIMNFFKDLHGFDWSLRFLNTMHNMLVNSGHDAMVSYVSNYFVLQGLGDLMPDFIPKFESPEWKSIEVKLGAIATTKSLNKRLKIYYGPAGTGKTFMAMLEAENRCVACTPQTLAEDLLYTFDFDKVTQDVQSQYEEAHSKAVSKAEQIAAMKDGSNPAMAALVNELHALRQDLRNVIATNQPMFKPSIVQECMSSGRSVVLDEINLLPMDSLRSLQSWLDGKPQFAGKKGSIKINDGFEIIGTMNLSIGDAMYPLPGPLVDRCYDIEEMKLTPDKLASAF